MLITHQELPEGEEPTGRLLQDRDEVTTLPRMEDFSGSAHWGHEQAIKMYLIMAAAGATVGTIGPH